MRRDSVSSRLSTNNGVPSRGTRRSFKEEPFRAGNPPVAVDNLAGTSIRLGRSMKMGKGRAVLLHNSADQEVETAGLEIVAST